MNLQDILPKIPQHFKPLLNRLTLSDLRKDPMVEVNIVERNASVHLFFSIIHLFQSPLKLFF